MVKRLFLVAISLFVGVTSAVSAQQISVNVDGKVYFCSGNGGSSIADPNCVKNITDYCYDKTSYNSSQCFEKASKACKGAPANFLECVRTSTDYCYSKTSMNSSQCFDNSLSACGGNAEAMTQLLEGVRAQAMSEASLANPR